MKRRSSSRFSACGATPQLQRTPDGQEYLPQFKSVRFDCRSTATGDFRVRFVLTGTTLCFGAPLGLIGVVLSTLLSLSFFKPVDSPTLRNASDLDKILLYTAWRWAHGVANNYADIAALIHPACETVSVGPRWTARLSHELGR